MRPFSTNSKFYVYDILPVPTLKELKKKEIKFGEFNKNACDK